MIFESSFFIVLNPWSLYKYSYSFSPLLNVVNLLPSYLYVLFLYFIGLSKLSLLYITSSLFTLINLSLIFSSYVNVVFIPHNSFISKKLNYV